MNGFDEAVWKRGESRQSIDSPRLQMVEAVTRDIAVPGRRKSYILDKLGKPETEVAPEFWYFLGVAPTSISSTYMIVVFSADDVVSRVYLTRK